MSGLILPLFNGWWCFTNHGGIGHIIKHLLDTVSLKTVSCFIDILFFNPPNSPQWDSGPSVFLEEKWSSLPIYVEYERKNEDCWPGNLTLTYVTFIITTSLPLSTITIEKEKAPFHSLWRYVLINVSMGKSIRATHLVVLLKHEEAKESNPQRLEALHSNGSEASCMVYRIVVLLATGEKCE